MMKLAPGWICGLALLGLGAQTAPSTLSSTTKVTTASSQPRGVAGAIYVLAKGEIRDGVVRPMPGTHLRVMVPADWRRQRKGVIFADAGMGLEMNARESRVPFAQADELLARESSLESSLETRVDGRNARLIKASKTVGSTTLVARSLVVGNALSSASLTITIPAAREAELEPLIMAVFASASWDAGNDLHARAVMPFAFEPQGLKLAQGEGGTLTYTQSGRLAPQSAGEARIMLRLGTFPAAVAPTEEQARKLFEGTAGPGGTARITRFAPLVVGELRGYEGDIELRSGRDALTGYVALLFDVDANYTLLGQSTPGGFEAAKPLFRAAARSIKPLSAHDLNDPER